MARGLAPRSAARLVAAVRGFYPLPACSTGDLDGNPADDLRPPRAWPALPTFLSIEEVDALIAQPDVSTPLRLRDRAMIELLYATGLRVSELVGVRLTDLHLDEQLPDLRRQGQQGAARADRRAGRPAWIRRYVAQSAPPRCSKGPRVAAAVS